MPRRSTTALRLAVLSLALLPALACLPGCLAAAAGAAAGYGTYSYLENEAIRDYPATLESTWDAALAALAENGHVVAAPPLLGPTEGEVRANDVRVRVEKWGEGVTRVRVRVGTFQTQDHRRRAGLVLDAISRRLGT